MRPDLVRAALIGVWGLPSHLLRLADGRLLMTYGYRRKPFGNQARVSEDYGRTWSAALIVSDDGAGGDLGYPSTAQFADGSPLTVWYESRLGLPGAVLLQTRWVLEQAAKQGVHVVSAAAGQARSGAILILPALHAGRFSSGSNDHLTLQGRRAFRKDPFQGLQVLNVPVGIIDKTHESSAVWMRLITLYVNDQLLSDRFIAEATPAIFVSTTVFSLLSKKSIREDPPA